MDEFVIQEMDPIYIGLAVFVAVALIALPYVMPLNLKSRADLPPGPKGELFYGNQRQLPKQPWRQFKKWNDEYGDVVYLQMGSTPTIVLGSAQAAWDLLEKRSNIYSSRPRFIMGNELLSDGMRGLMCPQNDFWRRWRKALHLNFMQKASDEYKPIQSLESKGLMNDLLESPKKFRKHLERYAASVIVTVTYGRRVTNVDTDKAVRFNAKAMETLTLANIPGRFAVESFPILKYMPTFLAPWKQWVVKQKKIDQKMYLELLNDVRQRMKSATGAPHSFTKQLIETQDKTGMTDLECAYAAATPFGAGIETSSGSLACFFLACAKFGPEFLPEAQAEIDRVVGTDRMPDWEDLEDLPFVKAIVLETLRWRPIAVLGGTAHSLIADDYYKGYLLPKGSTVFAPLFGIHLNENDFPEPDHFIPGRFMEERPNYPGKVGHSAFGWGLRVCPGKHVGQNSVTINIARILWGFNISKETDASGNEIDVSIDDFTDGFNSQPKEFPCKITIRSQKHAEVIRNDWEHAQDSLKTYTW